MALGGYLLTGFIIGFVLIVFYVLLAATAPDQKPQLGKAIGLLLAASGIMASIRLFVLILTADSLGALTQADRLYVGIGALAALWLCLETVGRTFKPVIPEEPQDKED